MKKKVIIICSGFAVLALGAALVARYDGAKERFTAAAERCRGTSDVNASLVFAVGPDIASGRKPADYVTPFDVAEIREKDALDGLTAARPGWPFGGIDEKLVAAVRRESDALTAVAGAVRQLAALPDDQWSSAVADLQSQTKLFSEAHQEVMKK